MDTGKITKVIGGKVVKAPQPKQIDIPKSTFARSLILQLNNAIKRDAKSLVRLRNQGALTVRLEHLIQNFYAEIVDITKSFPSTGNRIPKNFDIKVQHLMHAQNVFSELIQIEMKNNSLKCRVGFVLNWLIDDVKHFVHQFNATYSSVAIEYDSNGYIAKPSPSRIPNRSPDKNRKKKFLECLTIYKTASGKTTKHPQHKAIQRLMNQAGFELPDRTYRLYLKQIANGTFDNFIQQ